MGTTEIHTRFVWGKLKETDYMEDLAADDNVKLEFKETGMDELEWTKLAQNWTNGRGF
jgi:hypothetical protein